MHRKKKSPTFSFPKYLSFDHFTIKQCTPPANSPGIHPIRGSGGSVRLRSRDGHGPKKCPLWENIF